MYCKTTLTLLALLLTLPSCASKDCYHPTPPQALLRKPVSPDPVERMEHLWMEHLRSRGTTE
jgi:hypothetical protein